MSTRLDTAMTAARVDDAQLDTPAVRAALTDLEVAILGTPAGRRTTARRRARVGAVIGAVALTVGIGIPAAASYVSLQTGKKDTDGSEVWHMDSPDAPAAFTKFSHDYPLAPGYSPAAMGKDLAVRTPAAESELGFRSDVYLYSMCSWERSWLTARATSDASAETRAAAALLDLDRRAHHPVALFSTGNMLVLVGQVQQGVRADQPAVVQRDVKLNCDYRSMR